MSAPARPAARRWGLATWLVCVAVLFNGFASIFAHATPGAVLRFAGIAQICSAASPHAGRSDASHGSLASSHGDEGDAGSSVRAAHCALCVGHVDPFFPASRPWVRFAASLAASGPARHRDVAWGASPERRRAQPRAPPVAA